MENPESSEIIIIRNKNNIFKIFSFDKDNNVIGESAVEELEKGFICNCYDFHYEKMCEHVSIIEAFLNRKAKGEENVQFSKLDKDTKG